MARSLPKVLSSSTAVSSKEEVHALCGDDSSNSNFKTLSSCSQIVAGTSQLDRSPQSHILPVVIYSSISPAISVQATTQWRHHEDFESEDPRVISVRSLPGFGRRRCGVREKEVGQQRPTRDQGDAHR